MNILYHKYRGTHIEDDSLAFIMDKERYIKELSDEVDRNNDKNIIVSSEITMMLPNEAVDELLSLFHTHDIRMICYIRNLHELIRSLVMQWIRLQHNNTIDIRISSMPKSIHLFIENYKQCIQIWSEKIGKKNIVFRKYGYDYFINGNICSDFIHAMGYSLADDAAGFREIQNESLKYCETIYFKDLLNRIDLRTDQKVIGDQLLAWEKCHNGTPFALPNDLSMQIKGDVIETHRFLLENYLDNNYAELLNKYTKPNGSPDYRPSCSDFVNILNYIDSRIAGFKEELLESLSVSLSRSYDYELSIRRSETDLANVLMAKKAIALWGCGDVANRLLNFHRFMRDIPLYIVDKDVNKHGVYFHKREIRPPEVIATEEIDTVIIASVAYAEEIAAEVMRDYPKVRCIVQVDDLAGQIGIKCTDLDAVDQRS